MRIKYQVLIAPATKYSTPSTDQRLGLRAAICYLQVLLGKENTFILLNMGLICFTTDTNVRQPEREQEKGCSCSAAKNKNQKMTLSKLEQKKRKIKPLHLQKAEILWKQKVGTAPLNQGSLYSFWPVNTSFLAAISPKTMISCVTLKWEFPQTEASPNWQIAPVSVSFHVHLRMAAAASLWLTESRLKG